MTLNINSKNWLATNAGASNCFVSTGISYTDPDGISRTGGTADVLNALYVAHLIGKDSIVIRSGYNYTSFKSLNGNVDVDLTDTTWAYNNDGNPAGEAKYCAPVVTPTPVPPAPGLAGTFEFRGPATGMPSVTLDLSSLIMKQASDYHFEMNDIKINNTSGYMVYLAMEVKLFSGARTSCPSSGWVFDGMDRTAPPHKNVRIKSLEPGELGMYDADFFQPLNIVGVHTVCLLIWGAWTQDALKAEIAGITG